MLTLRQKRKGCSTHLSHRYKGQTAERVATSPPAARTPGAARLPPLSPQPTPTASPGLLRPPAPIFHCRDRDILHAHRQEGGIKAHAPASLQRESRSSRSLQPVEDAQSGEQTDPQTRPTSTCLLRPARSSAGTPRAEQPCPPPRAASQGAHAPAPPPHPHPSGGPGGSLHLSLPGYSGGRCKANFGKSFRGETSALRCPALAFRLRDPSRKMLQKS